MNFRQFFHLGFSLALILLGLLFLYGGFGLSNWRDEALDEVNKIRDEIVVAKTLVDEGQVDTYVDLLVQLSGYCNEVKIPRAQCRVNSKGAVDQGDYTSREYVVNLDKVTMPWVVDYFAKLEGLPSNVRVVQSNLKKTQGESRRGKSQSPSLNLVLIMNEITFKQT